jgi:deoxyhypusine synthase
MEKEAKQELEKPNSGAKGGNRGGSIKGLDVEREDFSLQTLLDGLIDVGGQATPVGEAREIFALIKQLRMAESEGERPIVFLGYTSNMITCGVRDIIRYLCENKFVDAVVTTGGGIEEDFMKVMKDSYVIYDFTVNDRQHRLEGKNRTGNMVVPNENYTHFEEWFSEHYDSMVRMQKEEGAIFGPSDVVQYLGERIGSAESVYHHCARHKIPVFSPAITDGSLGDIFYCKGFSEDRFIIDVNKDLQKIMDLPKGTGRPLAFIIIGGGIVKYHILNACKLNGGASLGIMITLGNEFDCSNTGARPAQDVARGAIRKDARVANINYEASIVVPLIFANN